MKLFKRPKKLFELFKHPMLFPQQIILSDGSVCEMYSLSDKKPIVKSLIDSLNHPTWNPQLTENQSLYYKQGEVIKFRDRYGDFEDTSQFNQYISQHASAKDTSNIPIIEDVSNLPTEPEWMKYKRAAEEKGKANKVSKK